MLFSGAPPRKIFHKPSRLVRIYVEPGKRDVRLRATLPKWRGLEGRSFMTDREFSDSLDAIRNRRQDGLIRIYEEYHAYLFQVVLAIVGQREDAEDVTADLFLRLWESPPAYHPGNGHRGYLATIARNRAIDRVRANRRTIPIDTAEEADLGAVPSSENEIVNEIAVEEVLALMTPAEREIVSMKHLLGLTFREIAEATGKPQGTVAWIYRETVKKIRRCGYDTNEQS